MAKPRKFPNDIQKYFIITKILKECDLESQDCLLSVVSDPHLEAERNQASVEVQDFWHVVVSFSMNIQNDANRPGNCQLFFERN